MAEMRVRFLPDGSIKLTIDGEVPMEIHDATEESLDELADMLGGGSTRESHESHRHRHGHGHHRHRKA